jgi:hypothetical protein
MKYNESEEKKLFKTDLKNLTSFSPIRMKYFLENELIFENEY